MSWNDIHIEPVDAPGITDETKRVSAEVSPHYRPILWDRFETHPVLIPIVERIPDVTDGEPLAGKPGIASLVGKKVRVTGHLYFDDVHRPTYEFKRRSSWEVHPVYWIEIEDASAWVPFHEWAARQP